MTPLGGASWSLGRVSACNDLIGRVTAAVIFLFLCFAPLSAQPSAYSQSVVLTINHLKVQNCDQANFPVLIDAQSNALRSVAFGGRMLSPNAYDIAFSSDAAGNNPLPYERVRHDLLLGRIVYWVRVPTVSHTADTPIYIWLGNPDVTTDQSSAGAVWDAGYRGVWHLTDNASNPNVRDSTQNGNNGVNAVNTSSRLSLGRLNNSTALSYSAQTGRGDYTAVPSGAGGNFDFTTGNFTFEFWLNPGALPPNGEEVFFANGNQNTQGGYWLNTVYNRKLVFQSWSGTSAASTVTTSTALPTGTWTHVAIVRNGSNLSIYLNGTLNVSNANFVSPASSYGPLVLGGSVGYQGMPGCMQSPNGCFVGSLQEFRASGTNRSADWIATAYNNQSSPATFFSQTPWDLSSNSTAPICNAGAPQSFRVGQTGTLDGSGSYSLTGVPLSYAWQQVASTAAGTPLQRLQWSSTTAARPTVSGFGFGPLNFQLTVTQSDGESASCTVNDGAVATDNNGAVITATGNATLDSAIKNLLGPMVQLGKNPWPFFDAAAQTDAAIQIANMDTTYGDYWDVPGQGMVSVTAGSKIVLGYGTNFLSTFCSADGTLNPYNSSSMGMIVWYPTNDPRYPGQTGRRVAGPNSGPYIAGCQSDTQLTLTAPWLSDAAACPIGKTAPCWLQYSVIYGPGFPGNNWNFSSAPANYYDVVAAYYALYYRSGQDIYLNAARKLADRFWTSPQIDRGNSFVSGVYGWPPQFRCWSMMGMVLRALDTADGHPDMWAGLHNAWAKTMGNFWLGYYPDPTRIGFDARESGYGLAHLSYCALYDADPSWQQSCRAAIKNTFATSGTGYLNIWPQSQDTDGGWKQLFGDTYLNSWYTHTSVTLRNGSTAVTCNGNCNWQASQFALSSSVGGQPVWFTNSPAVSPTGNSQGDPDTYCYQAGQPSLGCTYVDATHFTLDRPYYEPGCENGCVKGWMFNNKGNLGQVGFQQEPFFEGILAWSFDLAGRAMACSTYNVPAGCDSNTSTQAYQFNSAAVQWLMTYGYRPSTYGMYYTVGAPVCPQPIAENNQWCTGSSGALASREFAADGLRGMMVYYQRTADPRAKAMIDNIYAGLWGKPGSGAIVASPDGTYDSNFDAGGSWLGAGSTQNKLFGQMFGFGRGDTWPVIRTGLPLP